MIYMLLGYLHAVVAGKLRRIRMLAEGEAGQGTVEYVGLILLVSLLMVGMVAAMKGFNRPFTKGGSYLGDRMLRRPGANLRLRGLKLTWADHAGRENEKKLPTSALGTLGRLLAPATEPPTEHAPST